MKHEYSEHPSPAPHVGDVVLFTSGRMLGRVAEVTKSSFRVESGDVRMLWLTLEAIFTVSRGQVTLVCEERGLQHYEL